MNAVFERDFVRYEQSHSDVVWRKASGQNYFSASARLRSDAASPESLDKGL